MLGSLCGRFSICSWLDDLFVSACLWSIGAGDAQSHMDVLSSIEMEELYVYIRKSTVQQHFSKGTVIRIANGEVRPIATGFFIKLGCRCLLCV